jgi:hypothetical protein
MRTLRFELECSSSPDLETFARKRGEIEIQIEGEWAQHIFGGPAADQKNMLPARAGKKQNP